MEAGSGSGKSSTTGGAQEAVAAVPDREKLVDLAVKFLNNPRVRDSTLEHKKLFLKKKGLTDDEIERAINIAQASTPPSTQAIVPTPPLPPPPPPSRRSWREYTLIVAVIGGVSYAVVYFVRVYVLPWLERRQEQRRRLNDIQSSVEELKNSIASTMASLNESTQSIRDLLSEQKQQLQLLTSHVTDHKRRSSDEQLIKDLQNEIGSLKGLLLNRHQFPTPPRHNSGTTGIPTWQRAPAGGSRSNSPPSPPDEPVQQVGQEEEEDSGSGTENQPTD